MLEHGHNTFLIIASLAIALMSGFTGLTLTKGASDLPLARRKLLVSMSAVALGGGIWSMHFVAMLGLQLGVQYYYDALTTLMSALVAILLTGIALLLMHFGPRTRERIILAGLCVGVGVPAMHYLGMSAMQLAKPIYTVSGILVALVFSLGLCVGSFWISYGQRSSRNILFGTIGFGVSVFAVHFIAMASTHFVLDETDVPSTLGLSNEVLALIVIFSAFVIAGAFLLVGVTFGAAAPVAVPEDSTVPPEPAAPHVAGRLPYEKDGRTHFVLETDIAAVRAEGHYTFLYHATGRLFCPLSISQVEERVTNPDFIKCHRSYLLNAKHVTSFERKKDNGVCYFSDSVTLEKVPVSRSFLKQVRAALGA